MERPLSVRFTAFVLIFFLVRLFSVVQVGARDKGEEDRKEDKMKWDHLTK